MKAEHNELVTRIGPGTGCGQLMRHYWQPAALVDEVLRTQQPDATVAATSVGWWP